MRFENALSRWRFFRRDRRIIVDKLSPRVAQNLYERREHLLALPSCASDDTSGRKMRGRKSTRATRGKEKEAFARILRDLSRGSAISVIQNQDTKPLWRIWTVAVQFVPFNSAFIAFRHSLDGTTCPAVRLRAGRSRSQCASFTAALREGHSHVASLPQIQGDAAR